MKANILRYLYYEDNNFYEFVFMNPCNKCRWPIFANKVLTLFSWKWQWSTKWPHRPWSQFLLISIHIFVYYFCKSWWPNEHVGNKLICNTCQSRECHDIPYVIDEPNKLARSYCIMCVIIQSTTGDFLLEGWRLKGEGGPYIYIYYTREL